MSTLLSDVRVIECATLRCGDNVGMLLGDLGADVIKVESPRRGDHLRVIGGEISPQNSRAHLQFNRNKRSVTIDLREPAGRDVFWRLFDTADVFVDGYVAGACDKLGIGYAEQQRRKPGIIYAQHSGFGAMSPYAAIPTHGQMMDALAGRFPSHIGEDGLLHRTAPGAVLEGTQSGGDPTLVGALYTVTYILAALIRRSLTGEGRRIDVAGADAAVTGASTVLANELNEHRVANVNATAQITEGENVSARYQLYETSDHLALMFCGIERTFWTHFCDAIERPDLLAVPGGKEQVDFGNDPRLRITLADIFRSRTLASWVDLARAHDIPIGPAYQSVDDLRRDEHFISRGVFVEGEHPAAGPFTYIGRPAQIDDGGFSVRYPAPALGEHTEKVLESLGFAPDTIAELKAARAV